MQPATSGKFWKNLQNSGKKLEKPGKKLEKEKHWKKLEKYPFFPAFERSTYSFSAGCIFDAAFSGLMNWGLKGYMYHYLDIFTSVLFMGFCYGFWEILGRNYMGFGLISASPNHLPLSG